MRNILMLLFFLLAHSTECISQNSIVKQVNIQTIKLNSVNKDSSFEQIIQGGDEFKINIDIPKSDTLISASVFYTENEPIKFNPNTTYILKGISSIKLVVKFSDTTSHKNFQLNVTFKRNADNGDDAMYNSSFVSASFIKSLAGSNVPTNEFLDVQVKLNIGSQKKFFTLLGADVGLGASTATDSFSKSQPFKFNEAIANFNYALYITRKVLLPWKCNDLFKLKYKELMNRNRPDSSNYNKYLSSFISADSIYNYCREKRDSLANINRGFYDHLKRTAFVGVGLKIFYNEAYIGTHIGLLELNGSLFGSYIFGGYYVNTYRSKFDGSDTTSGSSPHTNSGYSFNYYKHNIYFEAGLNIFSNSTNQFSTFFNSIRLKFGLMLPLNINDPIAPKTKDIISRLAIEVPLGIKRF